MDLKGFTTVDEVGGEDSQVREQTAPSDTFKPATASEEIDYINKILADIEEKTGDSDTDSTCVAADAICNVQELDSKSPDQQPTDDALTQAGEFNNVTRSREIASVQHGLSAEPIRVSSQLSVAELDSTQNHISQGTDHDERTCPVLTNPTSELSPGIEDTTSLAVSTDNGDENKLEPRHYSVKYISNPCVSGEEFREVKEDEQVVSCNNIVLGNISDLLADSIETLGDPNLIERDKGDKGEPLLTECPQETCIEADKPKSTKEQLDLNKDSGKFSVNEQPLDPEKTTISDSSLNEATGVIVKKEPEDSMQEDFDFGNVLFDPAEEFNVKEERIKEEPMDPIQDMPFDTIPNDLPCGPLLEDLPVDLPEQNELIDPNHVKLEPSVDSMLVTPSVHFIVEDKHYSREQVTAALLMSRSSFASAVDMDMFEENVVKTMLKIRALPLEVLLKNVKLAPQEDTDVLNKFIVDNSNIIFDNQHNLCLKLLITKASETGKYSKRTPQSKTSTKRPYTKKKRQGKNSTQRHLFTTKESLLSNSVDSKSSEKFEKRNPKTIKENGDSESEYIHIGTVKQLKKEKRKCKDSSKVGQNKKSVKESTIVKSVDFNHDCKPCSVALVDLIKSKKYQEVVREYLDTIKIKSVQLPEKLEMVEEPKLNTELDIASNVNNECKAATDAFVESDHDSNSIDEVDSSKVSGESIDIKDSKEQAVQNDKLLNGKERVLEIITECKELKREEDASDKDIENSKEEEIKQNLNELTAVFVEKEVKEKKVAQVIEKTPSLCKDGEIAEEQKKKKKKDVLQELEKRRSKHEKKRSKREEIVESKEEKARRLSLELGQIFKKDKEKKEKMNEEILSNKSSKEKKRTNSTESTTEDKGRSPSGEDAVLTSVFSRPKLKTFKIPRKKNVEVAKVVEQKSVLASREDQFTFKRTSGYAARTPVQVESSRWKKSKDSDTVGYKKQRRSDVNWYKDRTPSEGRGRSNSPQEQRRSEVNWYKDRTPSEGRGRSNSPQDQRRSEGNLYKDCTPSEGRGRSISPRDQGRGEMNLYKEDVPSERRGRSNSPQDHGLEEDMLDCPSPDSPDQTHDNEGEGHTIQGTNVDKHCQQWVHANSTEEQVPPPPPEIECWEKLAELLNAVKNSTIDKINTSRSTSQDSLVSVGCSQDLATEHIQLEGTREDKTLTKTSDKNKFNADEITGNTEIISTPKSQSTGIEHRHVIASVDTEEIEGSSKMLSYLEGLVLDEYNVNCKDIESRFVHLTKKQKIKLYEKKKKTYYETKKKYHNEKGDVENNERKQMRFKEYQRRRKDYYEMKLFLYEEKKREKKAAEEKFKPCAQLAKEVIDVENEVGEKYKANSVIGSEELVVDLTENNSVKVNAVMSDANNAEIINESEEKKVCESEEPDPKKQEDEGAVIHISQEVKDVIEASVPALLPPPLPPSELIAFAPLPVQSFPERSENEENSDMDLDSDMDIATSDLSDEDDNKDDEMSLLARFGVDISNLEDGGRSNVQLNLDETRDSNNISSLKNIVHKLMTCERQITPRTVNAIEIMDNIPKLIDITQSPDVPTVARMYTPNIPFKNVTERNISETDLNYTSVAEKTSGISTPEIAKACLRTHTPDFPKSNKIHTPDLAKLNVRVQPPDLARMGRLHTPDLVKNDVRILSPTSKTRMHTPDRVTDNNCPVNSSPEAIISEGISSLMKNFAERSHSNQKCSLKGTVNLVEDKEKADDAVQKSSERQSKWTPKPFLPLEDLPDLEHGLDESNDLEVVYSKITNPTQKRGSQWDALPSCYQEIPLAQGVVDNYKDMPLLGLQYVLEVRKGMNATLDKCFFICSLCSKKMTSDTLVAHVNSVPHKLKFSASHCKHVYDKYSKIELKEWTASSVKDLTLDMKKVEDKYGRKRMAVTTERDMSSVLMALKKKISEAAALSQADHEENVDKQKAYRAAQEIRPAKIAQETAKAPIMPAIPVVPEEIPLPPVAPIIDLASIPTPPNTLADKMKNSIGKKVTNPANGRAMASVMRNNSNSTESQEESEEYDVVLIRDQGNKFAKRQYNPGPNLRHRSPVRSVSPKRRRSRSPSPRRMYSPKRSRSPDLRRTRSRSRSRSRSSRRSPRRWSPRWSPRRSPRRSPKRSPRRSPRRSPYRSPRRTSNRMRSPGTRHRSRSRERNRQRGRSWSSNSSSSSSSKSHSRGSSSRRRTDNRWQHQHRRKDRHSSSPSRHREDRDSKLTEFREAEAKLIAMHKEYQRMYDLRPHTHPDYNREWQRFWDKRSLELQASGVNPKTYDFKSEWATFWLARMKELDTINFKTNRDALLWKFKIKDPGPIEAGIAEGWEISKPAATRGGGDRSPSPWEDERLARNPSPTPEGSNPSNPNTEMELKVQQPETPSLSDKKLEDEFSVIGTLRMLNELEEQLGSFGPAIATLLEKAIDASQQGGNPVELFKDPDNLVLVRYAREKLVSQISAGILGTTAYMRSMVAVERAMWLQSQAEKLTQQVKYLGLDIPTIARATQGMDRVQIAQYIAQYLLQVGKSDATEEELQNIIVAVSTNHAKLLNEQSSKLTQVQGGNVNVAKTPAETPTSVTSSPGSAIQPTAPQTPVLFPSGASCQERPLHEEKKEEGSPASKKSGENGGLAILQSAYVEEEKPRDMGKLSLEDLQALLSNFRTLSSEEQQALTAYLKKLEATDSKKVTMLREKMQKSNKNAVKSISKVTPKVQGVEKPSSLTNSSKPHVIPDQSSTRAQTPNQPPANEQTQNRLTPTNEPQAPSQPQANPQSQNQLTNHPGTVDQQMNTVNSPHLSSRPPSVNPAPGSNDSELRNDTTNSALSPSATQEPRPPSGTGDTRHNPPSMSSQMDFPRGPGSRPPYDDRPPFDDRGSYEDRPPYESRTPYDARLPFEEDRFRAYPESHNPHEPLRPETSYQDRGGFSQNRPPAPYQREYGNQRPDGPNPWWNHGGNRDSRDQRDFRDSMDNHWGNFNNPSNQNFYRNPGNPDPYGGPNVQQSFGRQGPAVNRGGGPYRGQFRGGDGNRFRGGGQHPHFQDRW